MAEKTVKTKQPEKTKLAANAAQVEKPRLPVKPKQELKSTKPAEKDREKAKQPNMAQKWFRETIGELRRVAWPTPQEAWRLTKVVLIVMFSMSAVLGILDFLFSKAITLLLS